MKIFNATLVLFLLSAIGSIRGQNNIIDKSFGTDGIVRIDFGVTGMDMPEAMCIQSDGKIIVAGSAYIPNDLVHYCAIARLYPNGMLDSSFGKNGIVRIKWGVSNSIQDVGVDSVGRILAVGRETIDGDFMQFFPTVYRFLPDGRTDSTFGFLKDGRVNKTFGPFSNGEFRKVCIGRNGRIYCVGSEIADYQYGNGIAFGAMVFDSTGIIDTSYYNNGIATMNIPIGRVSAQMDSSETIFMTSYSRQNGADSLSVVFARFDEFGMPDTAVSPNGYVILPFKRANGDPFIAHPQNSGFHIGVTTNVEQQFRRQGTIIRWDTPRRIIDTAYGTDGSVDIPNLYSNEIHDAVTQPDEKLLIAGLSGMGSGSGWLYRLTKDGATDSTFGNNGFLVLNLNQAKGMLYFKRLIPIDDNSFYVLGYDEASRRGDFLVLKFIAKPLSVNTESMADGFSIYPNPAHSSVIFRLPDDANSVTLYDALGHNIKMLSDLSRSVTIDVSNFAAGIYTAITNSKQADRAIQFVVTK